MIQEQKAKAYDEALKKANAAYKDEDKHLKATLERIFPELKESEDERIRQKVIKLVKMSNAVGGFVLHKWEADEMLAWIEKQGEQKSLNDIAKEVTKNKETAMSFLKSCGIMNANGELADEYKIEQDEQKLPIEKLPSETKTIGESLGFTTQEECDKYNQMMSDLIMSGDKIKPKFNVGDWIVYKDNVWKICNISLKAYYELLKINNEVSTRRIEDVDKTAHLWTIQDAKDGDVLYINNTLSESIMIYKSFNNGVTNKYASYNKFGFEGENYLTLNDGYIIPATKEQRDLLFQKMKEAGYEWDANKKKLKEIEKPADVRTTGYWHVEDVEQKPTDEEMKRLLQTEYEKGRADAIAEMQGEWSEEDEETLGWLCTFLKGYGHEFYEGNEENDVIDWLKSLRPQNNITDEELAQAKKDAYNDALDKIEYHSGEPTFDDGWSAAIWYLKKRNMQP